METADIFMVMYDSGMESFCGSDLVEALRELKANDGATHIACYDGYGEELLFSIGLTGNGFEIYAEN